MSEKIGEFSTLFDYWDHLDPVRLLGLAKSAKLFDYSGLFVYSGHKSIFGKFVHRYVVNSYPQVYGYSNLVSKYPESDPNIFSWIFRDFQEIRGKLNLFAMFKIFQDFRGFTKTSTRRVSWPPKAAYRRVALKNSTFILFPNALIV